LLENLRENSLKEDLSNENIVTPPLFSLVNTFNSVLYQYRECTFIFTDVISAFFLPKILADRAIAISVYWAVSYS
jgi:hypothetical protein